MGTAEGNRELEGMASEGRAVSGIHTLSLADVALLLVAGAYLVDRIMESRGWNRSSKTLRRENEDLVRRNGELEQTVARHETKLSEQRLEIDSLKMTVQDLQKRDQASVLLALQKHEVNAEHRHADNVAHQETTIGLLGQIRDALAPAA